MKRFLGGVKRNSREYRGMFVMVLKEGRSSKCKYLECRNCRIILLNNRVFYVCNSLVKFRMSITILKRKLKKL